MMIIYPLVSGSFFIILYIISGFIGSVDFLKSSERISFMCLYFLLYLVSARFAMKNKLVMASITALCIISGILYLFYLAAPSSVPLLKPNSLQFIVPTEGGHNHLGDLIGLGIVSLLTAPHPSVVQVGIGAVYFLFLVASFSKSAFLALFITLIFLLLKKRVHIIFVAFIACVSVITVITYTKELTYIQPVVQLQRYMKATLHIEPKPWLSSRDIYITQATKSYITSSLDHSFFGFGPGNFIYASNKSSMYTWHTTTDTHSILLTLFMESGALPTAWFLIFFILTVYIGLKTNNSLTFLLFYLFINFQTDYTYRIPLFFMLFFFFSGQIIAPQIKQREKKTVSTLIVVMSIISTIFGAYAVFITTNYASLEHQLSSLSHTKNSKLFRTVAQKLEVYTPYDESFLIQTSSYYERFNKGESVRLLEKLSLYSPHKYLTLLRHQLDLQKKEKIDIKKYLENKKKKFASLPYSQDEKDDLNKICMDYAEMKCVK